MATYGENLPIQGRKIEPMTEEPIILFIGGSGRSGSTLIDLLLNSHSQIQSVGEVHRLNLYARENNEPCTCGVPVAQCPFWLEVEQEVRQKLAWPKDRNPLQETDIMLVPGSIGKLATLLQKASFIAAPIPMARWINRTFARPHQQAIETAVAWYDAIRKVTKTRVLIDSTKDARRLKLLYLQAPQQFRLLYMIRDGRAVTASKIRREGVSMEYAARDWRQAHRKTLLAQRGIPEQQIIRVHYEQLCTDPESTLKRVCAFLGLTYQPEMLTIKKIEAHNIGGNPMRFRTDEQSIKLDEAWRDQLTPDQLHQFDRVAGPMNRKLGYNDEASNSSA